LAHFRCVNTFISNAKHAITRTYHHFDLANYRHRYLPDVQDRVNRRFGLPSLVGRLPCSCVRTAPCLERWLSFAEVS
jgi:hypothetical protein